MLAYAFRGLNAAQFNSIAAEEFDHIHDLFAAILSKGIARQLKQGLYREYVAHAEDLVSLRGKIDLPGTTKLRLAQRHQLACEYDELSENNQLNQIVKSTTLLLLRHGEVKSTHRAELKKLLSFFSSIDELELASVRWSAIAFGRNSQSYRVLVGICQLVVQGMLLSDSSGEHKLMSFVDDQAMSRLYEKFILEYYKKHRPELKPCASWIEWALEDGERTMLPMMQSDVTLSYGARRLIIDAKYYSKNMQENYGRQKVHSNNLYQVFTYVKNTEAGNPGLEVAGMLLYAETAAAVQPDAEWRIGGSDFVATTLDLRQDFASIARKLDDIAAWLKTPNSRVGQETCDSGTIPR